MNLIPLVVVVAAILMVVWFVARSCDAKKLVGDPKPCRSCGSADVELASRVRDNHEVFAVVCNGCDARTHDFLRPAEAVAAWDRQALAFRLQARE